MDVNLQCQDVIMEADVVLETTAVSGSSYFFSAVEALVLKLQETAADADAMNVAKFNIYKTFPLTEFCSVGGFFMYKHYEDHIYIYNDTLKELPWNRYRQSQ